jgi:XTP/dITP diphosphohydrolase
MIIFATNNKHKISEIQSLSGDRYTIVNPAQLGFKGDIPEDCDTLEGNALQKARFIHRMFALPCFSDDTGLEVKSLNGAPGVRSARYAGDARNSEDNIAKLLDELSGKENRDARFRCVIAYIDRSGVEHLFEGTVNGVILFEKQGDDGFGYDPVFAPEGSEISFAQMSLSEKNLISHRGQAVRKFVDFLINETYAE